MNGFLLGIIILAAIVGGYIIDFQKYKIKWQTKNSHLDDQVAELRTLVHQMKKRVENLEAIAASEPDEFRSEDTDPLNRIEVDDDDSIKKENQQKISNLAKSKNK